ncbi:MAG: hypothetical protein J0M03_03240 [Acidobacteria bacterium]|nr:hypothetical protein [Acidobacteriota bacterium]
MAKNQSKILVTGTPPLTQNTAELLQQMIEKALDSKLTDEQIKLFQDRLIIDWKEAKKEVRESILESKKMFQAIKSEIEALPLEKRPFAWREFGRQLYIHAESEGKEDPLGQLVSNVYQAKNKLLVKGNPPLSQQAAESYVEMVVFIQGLIKKTKINLTIKEKENFVKELETNFINYSQEIKQEISQSDALWSQLRYNWKQASKAEQDNFCKELQEHVNSKAVQNNNKVEEKVVSTDNNLSESNEENSIKEEMPTPKLLPPQFLSAIKNLRAKAGKISLFSSNKKAD